MTDQVRKINLSGILLALCLVLPFITGHIPQIGNMLSPMHIPVFIGGLVCGWPYGLVIGLTAPILRHFLFGMPPMPIVIAMSLELAAYGTISGIIYKNLTKTKFNLYLSLIISMVLGRFIWGLGMLMITGINNNPFTWDMFVVVAFVMAIPGIILHILLIPIIVIILNKSRLNFK